MIDLYSYLSPIDEIIPNLYLGRWPDVVETLEAKTITHIVNATCDPLGPLFSKYETIQLDLLDIPTEPLRDRVPRAVAFINTALKQGGRVFVHCHAGISRSSSIVAAYLMHLGMPLEAALQKIRERRACIEPNEGFMKQLKDLEPSSFALSAGPGSVPTIYKCKMCRRTLFSDTDLVSHTPAQHAFERGGRTTRAVEPECTSLFLAELPWAHPEAGDRVQCPHCAAKLGAWSWAGLQCSCGTWVTPAFQIVASRVDRVPACGVSWPPRSHATPLTP